MQTDNKTVLMLLACVWISLIWQFELIGLQHGWLERLRPLPLKSDNAQVRIRVKIEPPAHQSRLTPFNCHFIDYLRFVNDY